MTQPETPPPNPDLPRAAPIALWRALRVFLSALLSLFGAPEEIAELGVLARKEYALMLAWLRAGEAFLRRLLFIEALALADVALVRAGPRARRERVRRLLHCFPDKPEDWRVSFRVFACTRTSRRSRASVARERIDLAPAFTPEARRPQVHPASPRPEMPQTKARPALRPSAHILNSWPLAERLEAMLRAFNDPAPHARRLARALQRTPACTERLLAPHSARTVDIFGARDFTRADAIARRRCRRILPAAPDTG